MKKTKKYIKYAIGAVVSLVLGIGIISTLLASSADIPDDQVEEQALALKLVNMDEADYPSVAEMESRLQSYIAGETFTEYTVKLSIFLVICATVGAIGLSFYKLTKNKKKLIRFSIPAGGLILIFLISRMIASDSMEGIHSTAVFNSSDLIEVSTLINATLILLALSFTTLFTYRIKHILTK